MKSENSVQQTVWRNSALANALLLSAGALLVYISYVGLKVMVHTWDAREEYSYGYMIPVITIFLLWQKKDIIQKTDFHGAWAGVLVVFLGLCAILLGNISSTNVIVQYGALAVVVGLAFSYTGKAELKPILIPLLFLFFMIPLPGIFLFRLTQDLQLLSSQIGVAVIRLFGISVYLEGNVIDLGTFKLQVAEACSGLRYLFPMISLAFIAAYFFKVKLWKRSIIVLSSIPITIFMNSFRIGVIGVLVHYWGIAQAQGFLHEFEGWVVFMFSIAILIFEIWLFTKLSKDQRPFQEVFGLEMPEPSPKDAVTKTRPVPITLYISILLLLVAVVLSIINGSRVSQTLVRANFDTFPDTIGRWQGSKQSLSSNILSILKADDYIVSNYSNRDNNSAVNLYVAYFSKQDAGSAAHSPKACIPGGGWQIINSKTVSINGVQMAGQPLSVNRLVIQKGDHKELVYYWFQQRGRIITSEYLVKWYLIVDALKENRTDGAMVRLSTPVVGVEDMKQADKRLISFAKKLQPLMDKYIPR